ncbi:MAG: acyl-ACP--UDP-N-acetylglucosamine O-acyltransferase [Woeseiaceae bacterium]
MIHPTALIDPSAKLADSVEVGAYSIIGKDVEIGEGTWVGPHVVIQGPSKIGKENKLFQFSSIGEIPQDKKFHGEKSFLEIGDRNTIREFSTINRGTDDGGGTTRIGDDNWLMAYIHIAHDCQVGNNTIFANNASLAGHASIGDFVILGGFTMVHQFCKIGEHAFCGMGSAISKDIPPYIMVNGSPAHAHGLNSEGVKRKGFSKEALKALKEAYKIIYRSNNTKEIAIKSLQSLAEQFPEVENMRKFIENSERGILR